MATFLDEIFELIEQPVPRERQPHLERLERVLTDGYAHALALEAERWRLERRITELAAGLGDGDLRGKTEELSTLAKRVTAVQAELEHLRHTLSTLRAHRAELRAA
jgi:ABC-type phosphate transport system auxiliary subunit